MTVICEMLGVPEADRSDFRRWSNTAIAGQFAGAEAYVEAYTHMDSYIRGLLADKRAAPTTDLLSALIDARDDGDHLTEDELLGMVRVLVSAGHETTVNLIGNGVHALLTHPTQLALLRAEPRRLAAALEELLRFAPPVQVTLPYITTAPIQLGVVTIPAGEIVIAGLLSANRDPTWIGEPARLDISRGERHHLAFGHGIHHCVGAPLARLEGQIALGTLLARFPRLRLAVPADQLRWAPQLLMHGLTALPVSLR
jgi:cytochrome P450